MMFRHFKRQKFSLSITKFSEAAFSVSEVTSQNIEEEEINDDENRLVFVTYTSGAGPQAPELSSTVNAHVNALQQFQLSQKIS
ncbi:hypothetical protein CEXT_76971 [Caerostris extrusa]|uniref:Uncharacterized protein n=1 Tax=Caerostris extrusa TaxID=172846 RepID=A0AAV4XXF3_CAEEX|nr:hypothetical protein CEXT_76971 [Caerostris extrusa]